jgi:glycosyltransferase involved in cell wall biosynthesis
VDRSVTYSLTINGSAEFFHVDTWTLKPKVENAKFVRAISNFCRAQIMAWSDPRCWDRLHVVHCGVDLTQYAPTPRTPSSKLRLFTVGRLHSIKGYPLLLNACRGLTDAGVDWSLDMVGDGPERAALESLVREQGIESRVSFSGAVGQDRIQSHFDNADVMVISSFMEGVPVVLMEAMAKGRAVLATAVGGIPELVTPGLSGELVPPGSSDAIREGILRLHAARSSLDAYGRAGRAKIEAEFSIEQTADQMAALFRRYSVCVESESRSISPALASHPIA